MKKYLTLVNVLFFVVVLCGFALSSWQSAEILHKNGLVNPGAEQGKKGWSATGGTFTISSTAAYGGSSFSWDPSAASQLLQSDSFAIQDGMNSKSCVLLFKYQGAGSANITAKITDGTNDLNTLVISDAETEFQVAKLPFVCPSSGNLQVELEAAGDAAAIILDDFYIGENPGIKDFTEGALLVGEAYIPATANCFPTVVNAGWQDLVDDADCPGPTVTENPGPGTIQTTDADNVEFTVNDLPAGTYHIEGNFTLRKGGSNICTYRWSDGTNNGRGSGSITSNTNVITTAVFNYGIAGDRTFKIQANGDGVDNCGIQFESDSEDFIFRITRVKGSQLTVSDADLLSTWFVDVNIGGSSFALSTNSEPTAGGISDASMTMSLNNDSQNAEIPCTSTNDSTGLTCSAGQEMLGVAFIIPVAGRYRVCANWSHQIDHSSAYTASFRWVETPAAAQTASQTGENITTYGYDASAAGNEIRVGGNLCEVFQFDSAGEKTVRLFYEQSVTSGPMTSNSIIADENASVYGQEVHIRVDPVTPFVQLPKIVNQVRTSETDALKICRGKFSWSAGTPQEDFDPSGCFDGTSIVDDGIGKMTVPFESATFKNGATVTCQATSDTSGGNTYCNLDGAASTTNVTLICEDSGGGNIDTGTLDVHCMGEAP